MNKEIIKQKLEKFDYEFYEKGNKLIVKLGFSLDIEVEFTDENKIEIKDKLKGWNFLTGMFEMSVRSSLILNTVFSLILALSFLYTNLITKNIYIGLITLFIFILCVFWILLWTTYFTIKAENFKRFIESIEK